MSEAQGNEGVHLHVFKAEAGIEALSKQPEDEFFTGYGALEPPFNPLKLASWYEDSNSLPQNVAAYATNIDGFGYQLEPIVYLNTERGQDIIRRDLEMAGRTLSKEQFDKYIEEIQKEMEAERVHLKNFLDYISIGVSFTTLRKRTRVDLEVTGNAYWEVLRDEDGNIAKTVLVASYMMRLMPLDEFAIEVTEKQRVGAVGWEEARLWRRFRRYIQKLNMGTPVYFKEFGDPRVLSSTSGTFYDSLDALHEAEDVEDCEAKPASEMLHFRIYSPTSPYGVPRWVGNLTSVMGSREMEEVNLAYFKNKGVPPMAILVSGGVLTPMAIKRIEDVLKKEIQGKGNFHKIMVLEATTDGAGNASPRIEIVPLMSATLTDAVFQKYDERNIDKVGSAFRVPRLLRGDVRDFNKSTSWASIRFAEEQVFSGEREEEDFTFNRTIFADMGVKYWLYKSLGPTVRDPETIVSLMSDLAKVAAMTPNEVREVVARTLHIDLPSIEEEWAQRPPSFTLAGRGFTAAGVDSEQVADAKESALTKLENEMFEMQKRIAEFRAHDEEELQSKESAEFRSQLVRFNQKDGIDVPPEDKGTSPDHPRGDGSGDDETIS